MYTENSLNIVTITCQGYLETLWVLLIRLGNSLVMGQFDLEPLQELSNDTVKQSERCMKILQPLSMRLGNSPGNANSPIIAMKFGNFLHIANGMEIL
jgi:hypothetical protein